jgi:hypothetical protein
MSENRKALHLLLDGDQLGVEAATMLTVEPAYVDPPKFTRDPAIRLPFIVDAASLALVLHKPTAYGRATLTG